MIIEAWSVIHSFLHPFRASDYEEIIAYKMKIVYATKSRVEWQARAPTYCAHHSSFLKRIMRSSWYAVGQLQWIQSNKEIIACKMKIVYANFLAHYYKNVEAALYAASMVVLSQGNGRRRNGLIVSLPKVE